MADTGREQEPAVPALSAGIRNWLIMSPAIVWLAIFLVAPLVYVVRTSFSADSSALTAVGWSLENYVATLPSYWTNLLNSVLIGLAATFVAFATATPVAYGISFYAGRHRTVLLFAFVAPFLTSYLIRVISWQTLLGANGPIFGTLEHLTGIEMRVLGTPFAVIAGLSYQLVPFVLLPIYAAFNRVDRDLCNAADDLYSARCAAAAATVLLVCALAMLVLLLRVLRGTEVLDVV